MRGGVGGPLLCIGDLLSDVGDAEDVRAPDLHQQVSPSVTSSIDTNRSLELTNLFQKNYDQLNEALAGTDHSWTALTLKLCTALETANKLVQSTNSNAIMMLEKVEELEEIVKRGDSAVATAKAVRVSLSHKEGSHSGSQNN